MLITNHLMLTKLSVILFIVFSNVIYSQNYVFKANCYIGDEIQTERIDTLMYQLGTDLEFVQKKLLHFQPSYFNHVILTKKTKKPISRKLLDGYLTEYFDSNNRLVKYTYSEKTGQAFSVEIKYLETGQPYKLIEYFSEEHHSQNGIFSIQYDILYNEQNELIQMKSEDGYGYLCEVTRL